MASQEIKIFTLEDFDLKGKVKSCTIIASYGKEELNFDKNGLLTKLVTRYNESDYDINHYKYQNEYLIEKRLENYRDGKFDETTSIANFYTIDTSASKKITEKIYSYTKEFLDQYEYIYDLDGKLKTIKRTSNNGIDETAVEYTEYKGESTQTYFLNGVIKKVNRTSEKIKRGKKQRIVLFKEYIDGKPHKAIEELYDDTNKLVSKTFFGTDVKTSRFAADKTEFFEYNENKILTKVKTKTKKTTSAKEYIHQFDGENGNWVKQIITPDNTYITRKIEYFPEEESKEVVKE